MTQLYSIYILVDPRDASTPRYVGWTATSLSERLSAHITAAKRQPHTHRAHWINKVLAEGITPRIILVEETEDYAEAEIRWIADLRAKGYKLTNGTAGGKGVLGARWNLTDEQKQAISSRPRRKATPAEIEAMRQRSIELWERWRAEGRYPPKPPKPRRRKQQKPKSEGDAKPKPKREAAPTETRKPRKPPSRLGKKHSEETKRRYSEVRTGRKASEETKRRISEGGKGRVVSPETREKISQRAIERWARWKSER